jgi:Zn-finger protein
MNDMENCPGNPNYIEFNGKRIKDCSDCTYPHRPENYDNIMNVLKNRK